MRRLVGLAALGLALAPGDAVAHLFHRVYEPPAGVGLVPEGRWILASMSVRENLLMGAYLRRDGNRGIRHDLDQIYAVFPILRERQFQRAGTLSGGEQQMLAIARALMGRPKLLMLDEPSWGLAPLLVEEIMRVIRLLNERGTTILLVEQNARQALELVRRCYVLNLGRVVFGGTPAELREQPLLTKAYLGGPTRS